MQPSLIENKVVVQSLPASRFYIWLAILILFVIFSVGAGLALPPAIDWHQTFRPVTLAMIRGNSPYQVEMPTPLVNPPWALLLLVPMAILPENFGRGSYFILSLVGYAIIARKLGAKPIALVAFLVSPLVMQCLLNGNLDWMVLFGYILPPQIGLFFLLIKPQMGIGGLIFWLYMSWKKGGFIESLRVFLPVTIALLVSFLLYGLWPIDLIEVMAKSSNGVIWPNTSLWPLSLPVGMGLIYISLRKKNIYSAMAASPCFSVYLQLQSWAGALAAVLTDTPLTVIAVIGLWLVVLLRAF